MKESKKKKIRGFFILSLIAAAGVAVGTISYKCGFADGRKEAADNNEATRRLTENRILRRELAKARRERKELIII